MQRAASSDGKDADAPPALHQDDCVLVDRLLRSDPVAWQELVTRFGRVVRFGIVAAFVDGFVTEESSQSRSPISDALALRLMELGLPNVLAPPFVEPRQVQLSIDDTEPRFQPKINVQTLLFWGVGSVAATAAAWLAAIYWMPRIAKTPFQNEIVVVPPASNVPSSTRRSAFP